MQRFSSDSVGAVQGKLQALYESLSGDERQILEQLFQHAARDVGAGPAQSDGEENSIIIVGGRSGEGIAIPLKPGNVNSLNPQPIPPGRLRPVSDTGR